MRLRALLAGALCWLILVCPCLGWGRDGHRIVAAIAASYLSTAARTAVHEILGDETLAELSTWPDEVRSKPEYGWSRPLHYINLPRLSAFVPNEIDDENVVAAIEKYAELVGDHTASKVQRREALGFLVHFVGDVHQPLHVSFADDRGGNDTKVKFFGEEWNLHSVWDSGLLGRRMKGVKGGWNEYADHLREGIGEAESTQLQARRTPNAWANESLAIVHSQVYDLPNGKELGEDYYQRNIETVEDRLTAAGVRLAAMLNFIFQDDEAILPYVEDPSTIQACTLRLYKVWMTDMIPPGGGRNLVTLTIRPEEASWSRVDSYRMSDDPSKSGDIALDASEAKALLASSLTTLKLGEWFDLPREVELPEMMLFAAHSYRIQIEVLDGSNAVFFERFLPYGAEYVDQYKATAEAAEELFKSTFKLPE